MKTNPGNSWTETKCQWVENCTSHQCYSLAISTSQSPRIMVRLYFWPHCGFHLTSFGQWIARGSHMYPFRVDCFIVTSSAAFPLRRNQHISWYAPSSRWVQQRGDLHKGRVNLSYYKPLGFGNLSPQHITGHPANI